MQMRKQSELNAYCHMTTLLPSNYLIISTPVPTPLPATYENKGTFFYLTGNFFIVAYYWLWGHFTAFSTLQYQVTIHTQLPRIFADTQIFWNLQLPICHCHYDFLFAFGTQIQQLTESLTANRRQQPTVKRNLKEVLGVWPTSLFQNRRRDRGQVAQMLKWKLAVEARKAVAGQHY